MIASMSFFDIGLPGRGRRGFCPQRCSAGPLHPGVAICLVVIADVEEIGSPLECTGHCLDADIKRPAIAGIDDHIRLFPGGRNALVIPEAQAAAAPNAML